MRSMIEKHGRTAANGHWDPNLDAWLDTPGGRETAREFRIAVERDMSRAVFTPGIGDIPGIMDHAAGKLWLQFMTYSFAFMNRFLAPASQRIADRKSGVSGKSVSVRVALGGRRIIKKKKKKKI